MIARKNNGFFGVAFLVLLGTGSFFGTYNLVTLIIHNRTASSLNRVVDDLEGGLWFDPVIEMPRNARGTENGKRLFHVALTATDAPYSKWQCRIMYYWYKKQKDLPGSEMGKFTRILHSGKPDNLMDEIPTLVVDPLPAGLDRVRELSFYCFDELYFSHVVMQ